MPIEKPIMRVAFLLDQGRNVLAIDFLHKLGLFDARHCQYGWKDVFDDDVLRISGTWLHRSRPFNNKGNSYPSFIISTM
jgi:hypothetical protein